MILKRLKLQNIRSYDEAELEFPKGSLLLSGDVGSGKTSILLALQFALFGLQPGQKGASILKQGKDEARVQLEFEIDGQTIILDRTLKKKKSITQESNIITIDGKTEELSTSEIKNKVVELLNYPKEFTKKSNLLYKFTVYTPQEEMKAIIQERPEVRLDTLRHIFGIDRYRRIKQNSQILIQKIKESVKIKEVEIKQINILKEKLTNQTEEKIKLTKDITNLNVEYKKFFEQKQEAERKLANFKIKIEQKRKFDQELEKKQIELQGKNTLKARLEKELMLMHNQVKEKINFSPLALQETTNLLQKHRYIFEENTSKLMEINSQISVLESKKEKALQLKEKVISLENCPTCFQSVGQEHKDKIHKRTQFDIEDIEKELEPKIFEKNQIVKDIEKEKELISGYEKDKQMFDRNKIRFEHQSQIETKIKSDSFILDRALNEISEFEEDINKLKIKTEEFSEISSLFEKQDSLFDEISSKLRGVEITLAEKNKEIEILKKSFESLKQEIKQKESVRLQINYLRELQDWLDEKFLSIITMTEKKVLAKLRADFSEIFNKWFSILVSDSLSVRLDEDFTPIISQQDYEIDYDFLSGGERTAVALAYRLALNQILNSLISKIKTKDLVILDEPTDGFSDQQLDKMRDIFDQLESEQIILVSHEQKIESFVDNVIRIKKDGVSMITSG